VGEAAEHAALFLSHFSIDENAYRATACPPTTALPLIFASASSICSVCEKLLSMHVSTMDHSGKTVLIIPSKAALKSQATRTNSCKK